MANNLKDRTGEINKNINGQLMKIIKYNNYSDIVVEFDDKYKTIVKCQYGMFKNGKLGNPNDNTVYNIGRLGQGKYKSKFNKKQTIQYQYWFDMMKRCYSKDYHKSSQHIKDAPYVKNGIIFRILVNGLMIIFI